MDGSIRNLVVLLIFAWGFTAGGVVYYSFKNDRTHDKIVFGALEGMGGLFVIFALVLAVMNKS